MKKRVLVIHEGDKVKELVKSSLDGSCELKFVNNFSDASEEIRSGLYSLLLIDSGVSQEGSLALCRKLREQKSLEDLAIIMMESEHAVENNINGLEAGADDYIVKPLDVQELRARIVGRLLRKNKKNETILRIENYVIDLNKQKIKEVSPIGDRLLPLTPIEFKLLLHFLQNKERIFTRQELLDLFWEGNTYISRHTVDTHISSLRKKMGSNGSYLRSVFKRGYVLSLPDQVVPVIYSMDAEARPLKIS